MLFFSDFLFTQVRIKEKVVINTQPSLQNINIIRQEGTDGVVSGLVMKKRGVLQIWHSFAKRDKSPIPSNSHIRLDIRNGDTILSDLVVPRFNNTNSNNWNCNSVPTLRYNYYTSYPYTPFSAVPVQRGDTVVFVYVTDIHPENGTMDTFGIYSTDTTQYGWDVTFKHSYTCQEEILNIFVGVADTVLKFTKPASDSICPNIPRYNDNSTRRNWIDLELKATFGDSLMKNVWVKVDTPTIADSGGHSHNGSRPMGKYRIPKLPPATGYDTVSTFIRKTDSTGVLKFRYLASEFGGIEKITAKLLSDTTSYDTLKIKVKVDSLYLLPNGTNYTKVGGTCKHHGPGAPTGCTLPDNNHYGTRKLIDSIISIANNWANAFPNEPRLFINDISLPYGGGFDVYGRWEQDIISGGIGHATHRVGKNVDIRTAFPGPPYRAGVNIRDANGNLILGERGRPIGNRRFNIIVRSRGAEPSIHGTPGTSNEHYHLAF